MDILLYLLIAAFIGYVAYALGSLIFLDPSKSKSQSRAPAASGADTVAKQGAAKTKPAAKAAAKPKPVAKPKPAAKKAAPAKPKAAAKPAEKKAKAKAKPAPAKSSSAKGDVVAFRNPETGEEARIPPSYPFSKRWIKDALIAEGLLDRIYKNTELDDANTKKVTEALEKLQAIEKYVVRE